MVLAERPDVVQYRPRGGAWGLFQTTDREVLLEGPVGTGKTYAALWRLHTCALTYPGMKGLMLRKTQKSLTESAVQTYVQRVLTTGVYNVKPFSGNIQEPRGFQYPNGSRLVVGGLDNPGKVMSSEYDMAAIFEATQVGVQEWEDVSTRLRNWKMPFQQLMGDCNPDAPTHWLNQRCNEGKTTRLLTRHKDNPRLWNNETKTWTPEGAEYMARLENLTGVRRDRNLLGKWVAAEGQVYEEWNPATHLIPRFDIPNDWPRYWVIDFGFVHPFVWQWWTRDPDGALIRYREIYMTKRLVEDHVEQGMALSRDEPRPQAVITDHDAEDRATFERKSGYRTTAAKKSVSDGIQAVAERLRAVNGKPRLLYMHDSLVERDRELANDFKPTCTEEEYTSYVWPDVSSASRSKDEQPVKENDHGMDATRYMVANFDLKRKPGKIVGV